MIVRSSGAGVAVNHDAQLLIPAWQAIATIQKSRLNEYWLVTQPDHAHLSGAIAANFDQQKFPLLTPDVIEAIRLHDEGWAQFEGCAGAIRKPSARGDKPLTFLDAAPETFLKAWSGSIKAASAVSPIGHYIVSAHFRTLAEHRLKAVVDPPESTERLLDFAAHEAESEAILLPRTGRTPVELEELLTVLQFCDLISLAICAGVSAAIEFPQNLGAGVMSMERSNGGFKLHPSPIGRSEGFAFPEFLFGREPVVTREVSFTMA